MAEVAAAAGVSQGLAYRYFANKDELFRALVAEAVQSGDPPAQWPGTPGDRLGVLISKTVEARREHPEFFQLLYHVASDEATPRDLLELVERRGRLFVAALRELIVEGQATGEVAGGDPDQLVAVLVACLDGLARLALSHPEQRERHFPDAEIVMRLLRPPAEQRNP
jgi:AcrR family transcriptional regulator